MRLHTTQDVQAPMAFVFEKITNFDAFETFISEAGGTTERLDDVAGVDSGMCWQIKGEFRGKHRDIELTLENYQPEKKLKYSCDTSSMSALIFFDLEEVSEQETRLNLMIDPEAKNISARLILQSVKLAKRTIEKRLGQRVRSFLDNVEEEYRTSGA